MLFNFSSYIVTLTILLSLQVKLQNNFCQIIRRQAEDMNETSGAAKQKALSMFYVTRWKLSGATW